MDFASLGLSEPLQRAVRDNGYTQPTPIQQQAIPAVLAGHDIMAAAQTGTGKTAGFTLPLIQGLERGSKARPHHCRALILTPTRELAAQVEASVKLYGKFSTLKSTVIFGGVGAGPQITQLKRGSDILVATPGRLLDLYEQRAVKFDNVEVLVLDEADRMLDMGFIPDIRRILSKLPKQRQNLLFSATFSDDIRELAKTMTRNPVEIDVAPRNSTVNATDQMIFPVDRSRKTSLLTHLIQTEGWHQALVFCRTKHGADRLTQKLCRNKIDAAAIHGGKSQGQRTKALERFKKNKIQILVATDIAARGLDINQLPVVVNYDLPNVAEDYVHRIGRTGRAGATGLAVSLVSADEVKCLRDIERLIRQSIERTEIEGFEPTQALPRTDREQNSGRGPKPGARSNNRRRSGKAPTGTRGKPTGRGDKRPRKSPTGNRPARKSS